MSDSPKLRVPPKHSSSIHRLEKNRVSRDKFLGNMSADYKTQSGEVIVRGERMSNYEDRISDVRQRSRRNLDEDSGSAQAYYAGGAVDLDFGLKLDELS